MTVALIVVDVQNDFCEGGSLAVKGGAAVAGDISDWIDRIGNAYDYIFATRDWHNAPPDDNGGHFALEDEPDFIDSWPVHCVGGTEGADYHPNLHLPDRTIHVKKGQGKPEYSAARALQDYLIRFDVKGVDICGLAFDYCVAQTAVDIVETVPSVLTVVVMDDLTAPVSHLNYDRTVDRFDDLGIYHINVQEMLK